MILTLEIPPELNADRRKALASILSEAGLISSQEVAALLKEAPREDAPLRQGSAEWKALLYRRGGGNGVVLPPEATSREALYGDDAR